MSTALKLVKDSDGKRDYRNHFLNERPKENCLFVDFIADHVRRKSKRKSVSFEKNYRTLSKYLNEFSEDFETDLYTNSINEDFADDFILFLEEKELKKSYVKMQVDLVKTLAGQAAKEGYVIDPSFNDIEYDSEPSFAVYLSMNEITRIYYFKGLTRKQERIKDLFVLGCLTGLRHSDFSHLKKEDFRGGYIYKTTQKTKAKVKIPVHEYVQEIYDKWDGDVASGLTIQYFNRTIKSIVEKVGIDKPITYDYTRGGKLITETKQKWELISSHTARRSFATNMYLTGRMKVYEIMAITGHTTEKSFFRYIKIKQEDIALHLSTDFFFRA